MGGGRRRYGSINGDRTNKIINFKKKRLKANSRGHATWDEYTSRWTDTQRDKK